MISVSGLPKNQDCVSNLSGDSKYYGDSSFSELPLGVNEVKHLDIKNVTVIEVLVPRLKELL
jgi:hypothetical protein